MTERDIFEALIDLPDPAARAAFVDETCAADPSLRERVNALLRSHDAAGSFLGTPAAVIPAPDFAGTVAFAPAQHNDETDTANSSAEPPDDEIPLGFLAPATRPDSLGRIGHYEVLEVLGQGGFGIVFRAFDDVLHRVVAVKVLAPQLAATSPARKRFLREARTSAQVRHENVVQVYEVGEDPLPYIAMEFIPGETLQQRLNRVGPVDGIEVVRIGRQVAEGLAAAHAQDLIHRDIKPGNILLEAGAGRVKITDFGLARAADDASISQSGIIAGTPMYMAPEQAKGEKLDQRADLFSLGSVLYQMAAGRPPFRANSTVAVLKRVAEDTPRDIREITPETPQWLCDIIAKLHAKNPDERFQSAREVTEVLADCEAQLKANSKLKDFSCIPRKHVPSTRRRRWRTAAISLVLLPVLLLAVTEFSGVTYLFRQPSPAVVYIPKGGPPIESRVANEPKRFALSFDGKKSTVKVPSLSIRGDHSMTVETWVVLGEATDPNRGYHLIGNAAQSGFSLRVFDFEGTDQAKVDFSIRLWEPNAYVSVVAKRPAKRNQLIHIAGVYDADKAEIRLYLDGQLQNQTPAPKVRPSEWPMGLGCNHDGGSPMAGRLNEVRFSKVARYDQNFVPAQRWDTDPDTMALYQFDEGQGLVAKDSSGNRHHGLISDALWVTADGAPIRAPAASGWHGWPADAPKPAIAPFDAAQAKAHQAAWAKYLGVPVEYTNSIGMKFRLIPPGEFLMGSTLEEIAAALKETGDEKYWQECVKSEAPQHTVILTQPIYLGVHEVTQAEYEKVMGVNPSYFGPLGIGKEAVAGLETGNHPVEMVSWNDAAEFCAKLSRKEKHKPFDLREGEKIMPLDGTGYRLPSEAEWEFACRAGTATKYWIDDKDENLFKAGWFSGNSGGRTHAVGELKANPFGLFDTHGNVWERVQDGWIATWYGQFSQNPAVNPHSPIPADSLRMFRGGSFQDLASNCRSSNRQPNRPTDRYPNIGFRVSLSVDAVKAMTQQAPAPAVAPFDAAQAKAHQAAWAKYLGVPVEYTNSIGMKFRLIPPGEFMMGSTPEEVAAALKEAGEDKALPVLIQSEAPRHKVILTQPIYVGVIEVTQTQYQQVMGGNPSHFSATGEGKAAVANLETGNHPVEMVSWNDAAEFCAKLSQQEKLKPFYSRAGEAVSPLKGAGYRLPTEAEWESACRAGTTTRFWSGNENQDLTPVGWFVSNSGGRTHAAGELKANPFGLFDVHGNVWELVEDTWDVAFYQKFQNVAAINPSNPFTADSQRVIRGGFCDGNLHCRSSAHLGVLPTLRSHNLGFRVVLEVDAVKAVLAERMPTVANPKPDAAAPAVAPFTNEDVKRIAALPAEQQVEEVRKELVGRNPGFKGDFKTGIKDGVVVGVNFQDYEPHLLDLTPLQAFRGLQEIIGVGLGDQQFHDFGPLRGLPITGLHFQQTPGIKDLRPLAGMPIDTLNVWQWKGTDLTPLRGLPLTKLNVGGGGQKLDLTPIRGLPLKWICLSYTEVDDLSALKDMPLTEFDCTNAPISDLSPLQGKAITRMYISNTKISDLTVLKGMPIAQLKIEGTAVTDLSPLTELPLKELTCDFRAARDTKILRSIKTLERINDKPADEFWKDVDKK